MSEFGWVLQVVGGALVLIAFARLVRVLRNRRAGDEPTCRGCGYLLIGLDKSTERCPECGADLNQRNAVQRGQVRSLKRPVSMVVAAVVAALMLHFVAGVIDKTIHDYNRRPADLAQAVLARNETEVTRLLQLEPNLVNRTTCSPALIEMAVWSNSVAIFDQVAKFQPATTLSRQVHELYDSDDHTPSTSTTYLHVAAARGHVELMDHLIRKYQFDVNTPDSHGRTPLHYAAAYFGSAASLQYLLAQPGIDLEAKDKDGVTPFGMAASQYSFSAAKQLMKAGCRIDGVASLNGKTALHYALWRSDYQFSLDLLDHGADLTARDAEGKTAMQLAADNSSEAQSLASRLIERAREKGGDQAVLDLFKREPQVLHFGAHMMRETSDVSLVRVFLKAGIDPNWRDTSRNTRLHYLAHTGNLDAVRQMLDAGADINAINDQGQTPFMIACRFRIGDGDDMLNLLESRGADPRRFDKFGCTALYYAAIDGTETRVRKLLSKGLPLDLATAIRLGDLASLERMLRDDATSINSRNNVDGNAPIHLAIRAKNMDAVRWLDSHGANLELPSTFWKQRPIDLAGTCRNREAALYLVQRRVDVRGSPERNSAAQPLRMATMQGWRDVVTAILDRGVDVNMPDNGQRRPLDEAISNRDVEMVRLLLSRGADPKLVTPPTTSSFGDPKNDEKTQAILTLLKP